VTTRYDIEWNEDLEMATIDLDNPRQTMTASDDESSA